MCHNGALTMRFRIATKLVFLLLLASLLPLVLFGIISVRQVRRATAVSVTEGNANVSRRAAAEINQYVGNALTILQSTAENMSHADLQDWQRERILKNYTNRFDEFRELSIRDAEGTLRATSRVDAADMTDQERGVFEKALKGESGLSAVYIRGDLTPALRVAVPIRRLGEISSVLTAELNLLHMWYVVDGIRIGRRGILHVMDHEGRMIATGDGERKRVVFQQGAFEPSRLIPEIMKPSGLVFRNPFGEEVVAVGTRLSEPLSWSVIVEQPTSEAYGLATKITYALAAVTGVMLVAALLWGLYGGKRQVVDPIRALEKATQELAKGNLAYRVMLNTGDEFALLGEAFNTMAVRLKELQEKLVLEERHALFGRIAGGLAHDLKHPFQAIENVSRLMEKMHDEPEFRETFRRTVEREFAKINLFLQNLHNLTHEVPYQPVPISLTALLKDAWSTFEMEAAKNGIRATLDLPTQDIRVMADRVSLNRVFSNLISNALQAMPAPGRDGGDLTLSVTAIPDAALVTVKDTGLGIPKERISTLFDDFVTTKRRGLGLGLAIVRKIIQQHGGSIAVESEVGQGTVFSVRLPLAPASKS